MQLATTKAKASLRRYNQLFLLVAVLIIATVISRGVFMRPANLMVVTASAAAFGLVSFGQGVQHAIVTQINLFIVTVTI